MTDATTTAMIMMIDATTSMIAMNVNETANVGNTNNDKTALNVNVARQTETAKDMLSGNAKSVNKAVGLTLFAQDAKQALAASEQSETEFYLPLCEAQSRLELAALHLSGHYLTHLEGHGLMLVEKELDSVLLPLANLIKAKCVVQDVAQVKQWAMGVLSKALDRSLAQATGECDGSDPEVRTILSQGQRSAFPEVIKLGATPGGRTKLRQAQPLSL